MCGLTKNKGLTRLMPQTLSHLLGGFPIPCFVPKSHRPHLDPHFHPTKQENPLYLTFKIHSFVQITCCHQWHKAGNLSEQYEWGWLECMVALMVMAQEAMVDLKGWPSNKGWFAWLHSVALILRQQIPSGNNRATYCRLEMLSLPSLCHLNTLSCCCVFCNAIWHL